MLWRGGGDETLCAVCCDELLDGRRTHTRRAAANNTTPPCSAHALVFHAAHNRWRRPRGEIERCEMRITRIGQIGVVVPPGPDGRSRPMRA